MYSASTSSFVRGTQQIPSPKQFYRIGGDNLKIKDWIQGIGAQSPSPDLLTQFDQNIDGSIGGLGNRLEKAYNSDRLAPLFEFRDLDTIKTSAFEDFMQKVDQAIQDLHK